VKAKIFVRVDSSGVDAAPDTGVDAGAGDGSAGIGREGGAAPTASLALGLRAAATAFMAEWFLSL